MGERKPTIPFEAVGTSGARRSHRVLMVLMLLLPAGRYREVTSETHGLHLTDGDADQLT